MCEVLWFFDAKQTDPFHVDGRCLVRYTDGRVKQSVLPLTDARLSYAMGAHGVKVRWRATLSSVQLELVGKGRSSCHTYAVSVLLEQLHSHANHIRAW